MSSPHPLTVSLTRVGVHRGDREVVSSVDACCRAGRVTALAGPNGSGKSTLLEAMAGVIPLSSGRIDGVTRGQVAFVPQRSDVSPHLPVTVAEVVAMGRWRSRGLWRPFRRADRCTVDEVLELLGLVALRDRPLDKLSGGQRQRALVGQGLASEAPILLFDEPTAGVDAESAAVIDRAMRAGADLGAVVVHATHDPTGIASADQVIRLVDGRVQQGSGHPSGAFPADRMSAPNLRSR